MRASAGGAGFGGPRGRPVFLGGARAADPQLLSSGLRRVSAHATRCAHAGVSPRGLCRSGGRWAAWFGRGGRSRPRAGVSPGPRRPRKPRAGVSPQPHRGLGRSCRGPRGRVPPSAPGTGGLGGCFRGPRGRVPPAEAPARHTSIQPKTEAPAQGPARACRKKKRRPRGGPLTGTAADSSEAPAHAGVSEIKRRPRGDPLRARPPQTRRRPRTRACPREKTPAQRTLAGTATSSPETPARRRPRKHSEAPARGTWARGTWGADFEAPAQARDARAGVSSRKGARASKRRDARAPDLDLGG